MVASCGHTPCFKGRLSAAGESQLGIISLGNHCSPATQRQALKNSLACQVLGLSRGSSPPAPPQPALACQSLNSDVARLVTVANDTPAPVQLLWVNYEGAPVLAS